MLSLPVCTAATEDFLTWVDRRDSRVVRQRFDYSCGLAALATLLQHYYQVPVGEQALLARLLELRDRRERDLSGATGYAARGVALSDLARLARDRGLRAIGLRLPLAALEGLQRPVIVYLEQASEPHFAVLRGIGRRGRVLLADPATGNRRLSFHQFEREFLTEEGARGRVLLLDRPMGREGASPRADFFRFEPLDPLLAPRSLPR